MPPEELATIRQKAAEWHLVSWLLSVDCCQLSVVSC
jgi:hypothetical protein